MKSTLEQRLQAVLSHAGAIAEHAGAMLSHRETERHRAALLDFNQLLGALDALRRAGSELRRHRPALAAAARMDNRPLTPQQRANYESQNEEAEP